MKPAAALDNGARDKGMVSALVGETGWLASLHGVRRVLKLMRLGMLPLLLGCAPAIAYREGQQTTVELRLVHDTALTDSWQARGEVAENGVVVTFSRSNPCRYPVPSARVWRNGATIHLLPEWSIPDRPRPCPDELALEHYQARLTGLAPGEYTILVHGTADEERPSFPPVHVRVDRR